MMAKLLATGTWCVCGSDVFLEEECVKCNNGENKLK